MGLLYSVVSTRSNEGLDFFCLFYTKAESSHSFHNGKIEYIETERESES